MDAKGFAIIRTKGDRALFGLDTAMMKRRVGAPDKRPLADFLSTIAIKAKDLAAEMTLVNVQQKDLHGQVGLRGVRLAEPQYASGRFFEEEDVIFQLDKYFMRGTDEGEQIPVLYAIHHAEYDRYPDDADVLELTDETINSLKEAYHQLRIAEIYAHRVDWLMSADDETYKERLKEELDAFEKEFQSKDWVLSEEAEED